MKVWEEEVWDKIINSYYNDTEHLFRYNFTMSTSTNATTTIQRLTRYQTHAVENHCHLQIHRFPYQSKESDLIPQLKVESIVQPHLRSTISVSYIGGTLRKLHTSGSDVIKSLQKTSSMV